MAYAKSKEAKQKKRTVLLDEVYRQMAKKSFEEIKILDVAKGCGVAKGTVFNYFDSKETMFLVLLIREYGKWYDGLYQLIDGLEPSSSSDLQKVITKYIDKTINDDIRLFRLIGLGHSHLEENTTLRLAEQYRKFINDRVAGLGTVMAVKSDGISRIQGIKLAMTLHTIFVGQIQMATLPRIMVNNLMLDELEAFQVDFKLSVMESLKVYMNGLFKK